MGGEGGIYSKISKGPVHVAMDEQLNHRDARGHFDRRAIILAALKDSTQDYIGIVKDLFNVPDKHANYLARYWYDANWESPDSPCWWKDVQPIEPIVRQSLIDAIELANEANVPIDSYWMPGGDQCEVLITRSQAQLTRLLLTPATPLPPKNWQAYYTALADIWVVKRGEPEPWEVTVAQAAEQGRRSWMTRLRTTP